MNSPLNLQPVRSKKFTKAYAWGVVGMLWCLCFLNYADRQVLSAVFPVFEKQFALSKFQLGMIGSIFMWVYAASSFFAGYLTDLFKRKSLLLTGCFFWSVVAIVTGWCSSFWQFFTARALEGLGESIYFPASQSMISDAHSEQNRSKALGVHQSGVYLGTIAGSWVGAFLAQHYGWSYGFYLFGGLGVILAGVFFFFLREPARTLRARKGAQQEMCMPLEGQLDVFAEESKNPAPSVGIIEAPLGMHEALGYLLKKPVVLLILLAFICANFVAAIFLTWLPTFLFEKFQMKLTMAGFYSVIFIQIASALTVPLFGVLADKLSRFTSNGRVLVQIGSLLIGSITIAIIGKATTLPFLFTSMVLFGACKAGYDNGIFSALFDYIEPHVRGSAVGLMNTFGWVGGALGPLVVGAVATYGGEKSSAIARMSSTIAISSIAYILGAALLGAVILMRKGTPSEKR
ncbi:MAG: MFS transporter [Chthoniobacterales bacterium]